RRRTSSWSVMVVGGRENRRASRVSRRTDSRFLNQLLSCFWDLRLLALELGRDADSTPEGSPGQLVSRRSETSPSLLVLRQGRAFNRPSLWLSRILGESAYVLGAERLRGWFVLPCRSEQSKVCCPRTPRHPSDDCA